jgi:hypothetical protein
MNLLSQGDFLNSLQVTKVTDKSCWLDNKRYSWKSIEALMEQGSKAKTRLNANRELDWKDKQSVLDYHDSFEKWSFYICNGDTSGVYLLMEVKDGLVTHQEEYYLPCPQGYGDKQSDIQDGYYWVLPIKKDNSYYGQTPFKSNVFISTGKVNMSPSIEELRNLTSKTEEIYCYPYGCDTQFTFDYEQSSRRGLEIYEISLPSNIYKWFRDTFCSHNWGSGIHTNVGDDFIFNLFYGDPFNDEVPSLRKELDDILNSSKYYIDDEDSYGEYRINYIKIRKEGCKKFYDLMEQKLKSYASNQV